MLTAARGPLRRQTAEPFSLQVGTLERRQLDLPCGRVAYLRHGDGPALLLVHGIPTSARLWEPLLGDLGRRFDCIVPDLLGLGRSQPALNADLSSPGQADMLAAVLDVLGIDEAFAVFHDQGGAHGQQMLKRHGRRVRAVLFTDCVCYDNWPVPIVAALMRLGGALKPLARVRVLQTVMRLIGWPQTTLRQALPPAALADWEYALNTGGAALDAWIRYLTAQSPRWTLDAVPTLKGWRKPARVLWAAHDVFLPPSWGVRLARDLPTAGGQPVLLPFAGHFWQMEVPVSGAAAIADFFGRL